MSLSWKATRWHCQPEKSQTDFSQNGKILTVSEELAEFLHFLFYDAQSSKSQSAQVSFLLLVVGGL